MSISYIDGRAGKSHSGDRKQQSRQASGNRSKEKAGRNLSVQQDHESQNNEREVGDRT